MHLCDSCHKEYPTESFPNLSMGNICKSCSAGQHSVKAEAAMGRKAKELSKRLGELKTDDISPEVGRVKNILSDIYSEFGGTTAYASRLHWVIMQLCNRSQVPASVATIMLQILKLHHEVEQSEEVTDARLMTDDQLKQERDLALMRLTMEAMNDPEKLSNLTKIMEMQGLKVVAMDTAEHMEKIAEQVDAIPKVMSDDDLIAADINEFLNEGGLAL